MKRYMKTMTNETKLSSYRYLFPITKEHVFLNHAATSPTSLLVLKAVSDFYQECSNQASIGYFNWMKKVETVRKTVAEFINADADEIAFVGNTSEGISMVASGFDWKKNDAVIVPVPDFPSNVYPWMHLEKQGVVIDFVQRRQGRIDIDDIKKAAHANTRMIAISSVDYVTGFAADIEKMGSFCRKKGILLCVDAIQSLGVMPLDVKKCGIHFMASGGHKWLTGPLGIGILFIDKKVSDLVSPTKVGWKSVVDEENFEIDFKLKQNARQFEPGTMNISQIFGLGAAIELIIKIGVYNIYKKVLNLNEIFIEELRKRKLQMISPQEQKNRSGILSFKPASDPVKFFKYLLSKKIITSLRQGNIRISPHFYNNEKDVSVFFSTLDKWKSTSF